MAIFSSLSLAQGICNAAAVGQVSKFEFDTICILSIGVLARVNPSSYQQPAAYLRCRDIHRSSLLCLSADCSALWR